MINKIQNIYQCCRIATATAAATLFKLLLLLPFVLLHNISLAQPTSVTDAFVIMQPSPVDSTVLDGTFVLILNDTTGITNLQVKLGTDSGLTDIMTQTFVFDTQTGLPQGYSYERTGKKISLGIATFNDRSTYFGEARLQLSNGSWTSPFQFITN